MDTTWHMQEYASTAQRTRCVAFMLVVLSKTSSLAVALIAPDLYHFVVCVIFQDKDAMSGLL